MNNLETTNIVQTASQGGYQPAKILGLRLILEEGDTFLSTEDHVDFPNQVLKIPEKCIGIVEISMSNVEEGSVSVLYKDTITARRLVARKEQEQKKLEENRPHHDFLRKEMGKQNSKLFSKRPQSKPFCVMVNEDRLIKNVHQNELIQWSSSYLSDGRRWINKVEIGFYDKQTAIQTYNNLLAKECRPSKNWI